MSKIFENALKKVHPLSQQRVKELLDRLDDENKQPKNEDCPAMGHYGGEPRPNGICDQCGNSIN